MSKEKDFFLEDLLKESEESLKELDQLEDFFKTEADKKVEDPAPGSPVLPHGVDDTFTIPVDGYVEISVAAHEMAVYGNFYPPSKGKNPLTVEEVEKRLLDKGIVYGIQWDTIQDTIFTVNTEGSPCTDILIAEGKQPVREIPEHYEMEEHVTSGNKNVDTKNRRIDYREVSPFVLVKKEDVLARYIPMKPGAPGYNVYGKEIPFGKKEIIRRKPGKKTVVKDDVVAAACDGRLECSDAEFWVNEVLAIDGDVGYKTGHIDFPGDVIIKGQIKDNFIIRSGGNIFCEKTMDASEVSCGKDLHIKLGIIGRKKGKVKVGGKLRAKFIENCYVETKGPIYLDAGILNSTVYSLDRIEMQKRGVIVGGTVYAQNGIIAMQIGTAMGPKTEIYCGVDYIVANQLGWMRDKNIELTIKLQRLKEKYKKNPGDEELKSVIHKIEQAIQTMNNSAIDLVSKLDKNDNAEIIVRGSVFPGVYLEICHVSYTVEAEMSRIRFRLDKEHGKIIPDTLN